MLMVLNVVSSLRLLYLISAVSAALAIPAVKLRDGGYTIPAEVWAYVNVRPNAYMFWWLYGCNNSSLVREEQPLVMWLQVGTW